jgi:hypothetical protein
MTFCWSRYLLKYERYAYVIRQASSRCRNRRSSGDLFQVSLCLGSQPSERREVMRGTPDVARPSTDFLLGSTHRVRREYLQGGLSEGVKTRSPPTSKAIFQEHHKVLSVYWAASHHAIKQGRPSHQSKGHSPKQMRCFGPAEGSQRPPLYEM